MLLPDTCHGEFPQLAILFVGSATDREQLLTNNAIRSPLFSAWVAPHTENVRGVIRDRSQKTLALQ